jgi:gelsolin
MRTDDVMILDSGDEIYVWVGDDASKEEKDKALDMAKVFILVHL